MPSLRYNVDKAFIKTYRVLAANTVRQGVPVMLSGTDIVEANSTDDLYIGVAWAAEDGVWANGAWTAPALSNVEVVMRGSPCCIPVRSTAAGITAGAFVVPAAGGVVNQAFGGGAVLANPVGQALETATAANELVGVNVGAIPPSVTA